MRSVHGGLWCDSIKPVYMCECSNEPEEEAQTSLAKEDSVDICSIRKSDTFPLYKKTSTS